MYVMILSCAVLDLSYSHISRLILRLVSISYSSPYPDTSRCMQPACLHNIWTSGPLLSFCTFMSSHIWWTSRRRTSRRWISRRQTSGRWMSQECVWMRSGHYLSRFTACIWRCRCTKVWMPEGPSIHPRFIQHTQSENQHSAPFRHTPVSSYLVIYLSVTYVSLPGYLYSCFCLLIFVTVHLQVHLLMIRLRTY